MTVSIAVTSSTTIKVTGALRDRLKAQASAAGRTLGQHIEVLADNADRDARFAAMKRAIDETPPELLASYVAETAEWDTASLADLPRE